MSHIPMIKTSETKNSNINIKHKSDYNNINKEIRDG